MKIKSITLQKIAAVCGVLGLFFGLGFAGNFEATGKTYTVKPGDTLWSISKKYLGNGSRYSEIYKSNKAVIGSNPGLIKPGQVLTIPG